MRNRFSGRCRAGTLPAVATLSRRLAILVIVAGVTLAATTSLRAATCTGHDLLPELKSLEPEAYARVDAAAQATPNTQALLWRIEPAGRNDLAPSYLFGTIHLSDERVTTLPPAARAALDHATTVMLEVADLSPGATQAVMAQASDLFIFSDGRRLDRMLSPNEFKTVQATVAAAGMPGEIGATFKPWIISMLLSVSECERRKVQAGAHVLDMQIADIAKKHGIDVIGLETIKEQLTSLADVPVEQQLEMLRATLRWAHRVDDLVETILQFYLKRQMGAAWPLQIELAKLVGIDPAPLATFHREVLVKRNERMRDRALPYLEKGGAFIAVGALHHSGSDGLVAMLRNAGYTVTPVE